MKTSYIPFKLSEEVKKIHKEHRFASEVQEYQLDSSFLEEVRRWSELDQKDVDGEAVTIPSRKIRKLAMYMPQNSLKLSLDNLARILFLRMNEDTTHLIYTLWQDFFENKDLCRLLYDVAEHKPELLQKILLNTGLKNDIMLHWFESKNIPYEVGSECMRLQSVQRLPFEKRLETLGILSSTQLGQKCIQKYLTFCDRAGYLEMNDENILFNLKTYSQEDVKLFLKNILSELETEDFQGYYQCGSYIRDTYTGNVGTEKYKKYFTAFTEEQESKYHHWLNYILIKETFGKAEDDERLKFWSKYVPYSVDVYRVQVSASLVIEFKEYCITEFFEDTKGALYIYKKDIFKKHIVKYVQSCKNQRLRHELYDDLREYYVARIVHSANWRDTTARYLRLYWII